MSLTIVRPSQYNSIVCANFDQGFRVPEMVKPRLCAVTSPTIDARVGLCTVVQLSKTNPSPMMPYHYQFQISF